MSEQPLPVVRITYCTQCQWLLRAGWMAQELLSTFGQELGEVTLVPGTGGIFTVTCNGKLIWDRKRDGGFPDAAKLKQLVRDVIDPERDLGHADRKKEAASISPLAGEMGGSPEGGDVERRGFWIIDDTITRRDRRDSTPLCPAGHLPRKGGDYATRYRQRQNRPLRLVFPLFAQSLGDV